MASAVAPKPVIVAVEGAVDGRAILPDLERAFGGECAVYGTGLADDALRLINDLAGRDEPIALVIAEQRLEGTTGSDVLRRVKLLVPEAKTVLLTPQADAAEAIDASNELRLDRYVIREWDRETRILPELSRLLEEWRKEYRPPPRVKVVASRFSEESHAVRDFLARNHVEYTWLDAERDQEAGILFARARPATADLPILFFDDGTWLQRPTTREVAEKLGLRTRAELPFYDVIIVGGGPAGLAAAVYGASEGLRTVLVERDAPGGQAGQSSRIENYLGFPAGLSGSELASRATTQARRLGAGLLSVQDAVALEVEGTGRQIRLSGGGSLSASCVLVASGISYNQLDAPGFERFTGAGIYYGAAMTEARACQDQSVVVIGGANSAGQAARYFSQYAGGVLILVRAASLAKAVSAYLGEQTCGPPHRQGRPPPR